MSHFVTSRRLPMKKAMSVAFVSVLLSACGSSGGTTSGTSDSSAPASKGSASASAAKAKDSGGGDGKWVKLDKANNVQIQVDADAVVSDGVGSGNMVMSAVAPVSIKVAGDTDPKTLDEYKKSVADFTPKNAKDGKLDDGWWSTWENTGSMGTNYWVSVYRTIDKKGYICDTSVDTQAKGDAALKVCKTLKQ